MGSPSICRYPFNSFEAAFLNASLTWSAVTEAGGIVVGSDVKLIFNVQFAPAQA